MLLLQRIRATERLRLATVLYMHYSEMGMDCMIEGIKFDHYVTVFDFE